jgi:hypothetical protein
VGDSWKAEIPAPDKDTPKLSFEFTAKKTETVDGADLLVVESKGKEDGTDSPLTADGTWWLDKTGKAVKFKLKFVNWRVPEAGGAPMDITFDGKLSS